jgi:hypothetical protein
VAVNLYSLQVSKNFSQKKASPMSLPVAKIAATHVKMQVILSARCMMPSALHAGKVAKFLSNQEMTVPYTAANALLNKDNF